MFGAGEEGWVGGYLDTGNGLDQSIPVLQHYSHGAWQPNVSLPTLGAIYSLHFAGGQGWAVGTHLWRYTGETWQPEAEPDPCADPGCYPIYAAVRATGPGAGWAVGSTIRICVACRDDLYAVQRSAGGWHPVALPLTAPADDKLVSRWLENLAFADAGTGWAVGGWQADGEDPRPLILRYQGNHWHVESVPEPARGRLRVISLADADHALAMGDGGLVLAYGYAAPAPPASPTPAPTALPTSRVACAPPPSPARCFPLVGHSVQGDF